MRGYIYVELEYFTWKIFTHETVVQSKSTENALENLSTTCYKFPQIKEGDLVKRHVDLKLPNEAFP